MNIRRKLFGVMAVLVLLVTAVYFGTTQGYLESRFGRYSAEEMAVLLQTYYEEHGNSWAGVEQVDIPGSAERKREALRGDGFTVSGGNNLIL